jgi:hypothetical protein
MPPNGPGSTPEVPAAPSVLSPGEQASIEADQLAAQTTPVPEVTMPEVAASELPAVPEEGSVGQAAEVAASLPGMPNTNAAPEQITLPAYIPVVEGPTPERGTVTLPEGSLGTVAGAGGTIRATPQFPTPPAAPETQQ